MSWLEKEISKRQQNEDYILEGYIIDITENICERMYQIGITKKELAQKMNTSPAWITKLLNGNNNFTLRTLLKISNVLKLDLTIDFNLKKHYTETQSSDYMTLKTDETMQISIPQRQFSIHQRQLIYSADFDESSEKKAAVA